MLSDRSYMRESYGRPPVPAVVWIVCILAATFVLENVALHWFGGSLAERILDWLTLSHAGIVSGRVWTLLTHGLIHDPNGLIQLVFVLLAVYFFGRPIASEIGDRAFLGLFAASVCTGGVAWLGVNWLQPGGQLFGASAFVSALIVLAALLDPGQPVTLFFIDVGLRLKHLAIGLLAIDLLGLVLVEIPGRGSWFAMAHSAHLGGMLAGWLFFRIVRRDSVPLFTGKPAVELPRWFRKARGSAAESAYKVNLTPASADLRAEIDRILDKINSDGFQSLTDDEKRVLDQARDQLSRR